MCHSWAMTVNEGHCPLTRWNVLDHASYQHSRSIVIYGKNIKKGYEQGTTSFVPSFFSLTSCMKGMSRKMATDRARLILIEIRRVPAIRRLPKLAGRTSTKPDIAHCYVSRMLAVST